MSIFYQQFFNGSHTPKRDLVSPLVGKPIDELFFTFQEFSTLIFNSLNFPMKTEDTRDAWKPIEARLRHNVLESVLKREERDGLVKSFDYVELMSLQAGIFARLERASKIMRRHLEEAFKRIECPFKLEGVC